MGQSIAAYRDPGGLGFHVVAVRLTSTQFTLFLPTGVSSAPGLAKLVGGCNPRPGCSVVRSTLGGYLSRGPSTSIIEPTGYAVGALYYWRRKNLFHRDGCSSSGSGEVPEVPEVPEGSSEVVLCASRASSEAGASSSGMRSVKATMMWSLVAGEAQKAVGTQPLSATPRGPA